MYKKIVILAGLCQLCFVLAGCNNKEQVDALSTRVAELEKLEPLMRERGLLDDPSHAFSINIEELQYAVADKRFRPMLTVDAVLSVANCPCPEQAVLELGVEVMQAERAVAQKSVSLALSNGAAAMSVEMPLDSYDIKPEQLKLRFTPVFWYNVLSYKIENVKLKQAN